MELNISKEENKGMKQIGSERKEVRDREKRKTLEAKPENKNDKVHILVAEKPQGEKENQSSFPPYLIS